MSHNVSGEFLRVSSSFPLAKKTCTHFRSPSIFFLELICMEGITFCDFPKGILYGNALHWEIQGATVCADR